MIAGVSIPKIALIGSGVRGIRDLTLRSLQQLQESDETLCLGISPRDKLVLRRLGVRGVRSLDHLYKQGSNDIETYAALLDEVLKAGTRRGSVALLLPGHPAFGVTIASWLRELAAAGSIQLAVFDGISSFDTMLTDLGVDPLTNGTVVIDANRLIVCKTMLNPRLDHFVYHICSVSESTLQFRSPGSTSHLDTLARTLAPMYPKGHTALIISSKPNGRTSIVRTEVAKIATRRNDVRFDTSLFIPALMRE